MLINERASVLEWNGSGSMSLVALPITQGPEKENVCVCVCVCVGRRVGVRVILPTFGSHNA